MHIDIEIDKLTNSIENRASGEIFDTELLIVQASDLRALKKKEWLFDWDREITEVKGVYKLVISGQPLIIQGLISLEDKGDHIFVHLVENAKHNKNPEKRFIGGAGNMFAFACKKSFEAGYEGYISFISKTALIQHYIATLGAKKLFKDTMVIEPPLAKILIDRYFK